MGTITVNVKNDIEKEFRKIVRSVHGTRKGSLGEAITEAMKQWIYEKKQEKIKGEAIRMMEQGFKFGKRLYKNRSELYER